jgi:adenylyltransferase/sulfurtransferase
MERYQAQLALPDFGPRGQRRLLDSRVLLVGVGGLGCPAALYLAAAGVGSLTLVDDDIVELSNLQRQILYTEADLAQPKAEAAALRLRAANPEIRVDALDVRLTAANAGELVDGHDLVLDGSDNFATRYVVNDAAVLGGVPLISGSLYRYEGQLLVVRPPETACYRCLFRAAPPEAPPCHDAGILGAVAGIVGTLQAAEAINLLASGNSGLAGRLLLVNAKEMSMHTIEARPDPACPLCGSDPTIERPTAVAVCETG